MRQAVGAAMRMMGEIFVMGRTIDEAVKRMRKPENRGFTASFDMLGEAARTFPDAERYFEAYDDAIAAVGSDPAAGHSISVKLSALHPRYEVAQYGTLRPGADRHGRGAGGQAARHGIALTVDAEESERLEMSLDIIDAVAALPASRAGTGSAWRCRPMASARGRCWTGRTALGRLMNVRLVKGAYWDSEIKRTQVEGLSDYPLFTRKAATDVSYLAVRARHAGGEEHPAGVREPQCADGRDAGGMGGERPRLRVPAAARDGRGAVRAVGARAGLSHARIYAPVGGHRDLLAYLVRRLLENGANSSFVHQLADERVVGRGIAGRSGRQDRGGGRHAASEHSVAGATCSGRGRAQEQRRDRSAATRRRWRRRWRP